MTSEGTPESRKLLIHALQTLIDNIDGKKVGKIDDPRFEALRIIDENWDDIVYEDFWKVIPETSNIDVQSKALRILLKKRGIKAYGRIFRYIESGKIGDTEMIATRFAKLIFDQFSGQGSDEGVEFSIGVLSKSFTREKSGIYVLLKPLVETLLDLLKDLRFDTDYRDRYIPTRQKVVEFINNIIDDMATDMIPHVVSMFTTSTKSTKFTRFMLTEIKIPPKLSAMFLLKRRAGIIRLSQFASIVETGKFHPFSGFLLKKLVSYHEIERYNAANVLKDIIPKFYISADADLYVKLISAPHTPEFLQFLQVLEDTRLSFSVVLSFLQLSKAWSDVTDDDLNLVVSKLNFSLFMRELTSGVKKLDYQVNLDLIDEVRPAELNLEEIKFVERMQKEKIATKFFEDYPDLGVVDAEQLFIELYPDAPESIVQVIFLMDKKTVIKLEGIGYIRYLMDAEEFTYTSMVERKSQLVSHPSVEFIRNFLRKRKNRMWIRGQGTDIQLATIRRRYNEETYDLLAFSALFLPLILIRFIRMENNPKILEILLRVIVQNRFVHLLPEPIALSMINTCLVTMEKVKTEGIENRLISLFFIITDYLSMDSLEKIENKLSEFSHSPIYAGLRFYLLNQIGKVDLEYKGIFSFRNFEMTVRMTYVLIELLSKGYSQFEDDFIRLVKENKSFSERYIPAVRKKIKANLHSFPPSLLKKINEDKDLALRVLFNKSS